MHDLSAPYAANIRKYFVYTALKGLNFGLVTAIWVIFLQQQHNLSLAQVTLIDVAFWLTATLGELPTGIIADSYGRKASLAAGAAIMGCSILAWAFAPTVPLVVAAYVILAFGVTFLSGAEDAFFFESLKQAGRAREYTRLAGRVSATTLAATATGNLSSGLLASLDLRLPLIVGSVSLLVMLGIVLTFREPTDDEDRTGQPRPSYLSILKQAVAIMRARPTLRYAIFYFTLLPLSAMVVETVFLQPQALALGVPLAGVGAIVMAAQLSNMAGATASHRVKARFGDERMIYLAPFAIALSLLFLGWIDQLPALTFAATVSFFTALLRPMMMSRIQNEVSDNIRATVLSMQSLMFAGIAAVVEPLLGYVADEAGLSVSYYTMAGGLTLLMLLLFWRSRKRFP